MTKDELFQINNNKLFFDREDIEKLANKHGTPVYLFSERKIKENIDYIEKSFQKNWVKTQIAYSMKNNSLLEVCDIIADKLSLFEVSSLAELLLIEKISKTKKTKLDVIVTSIYKSDELITKSLDYDNSILAIDSFQDLKNIERIAKDLKKKPKVLVRVNPGIKMDYTKELFASAFPDAKCASIINDIEQIKMRSNDPTISLWLPDRLNNPKSDSAENLILKSSESKHLELIGIHCHLGSQITQLEYFERFFEVICIFYKIMNEQINNELKILDFGGGYPIDYLSDGSVPTLSSISQSLTSNLNKTKINPDIVIESGRFITATAATLISQVKITKESSSGRNLAILDMSVYSDLLDILVAKWYYDCSLVNDLPKDDKEKITTNWDLVGVTNDALDHFISSNSKRAFPRNLKINDLIAIKNTGAYTTCFNSTYSGKPIPKKVIIPMK
jgi:diaminopimelate decarboxylase